MFNETFGPDKTVQKLLDEGNDPLELSIEKWTAIVEGKGKNEGWFNCALCLKYFNNNCKGCPVKNKTHRIECASTPYRRYGLDEMVGKTKSEYTDKQIKGCKAELDFLISLRSPVPIKLAKEGEKK